MNIMENLTKINNSMKHKKLYKKVGRTGLFREELDLIKDEGIRQFTEQAIECLLPAYFFTTPASQSGKYHPLESLGEGGLVRHTKACVKIAVEFMGNDSFCKMYTEHDRFTDLEHDMVISALLLHDGFKCGDVDNGHTMFAHPTKMVSKLLNVANSVPSNQKQTLMGVCALIESHMGQWNRKSGESVTLPLPATKLQHFVHICDYVSSRKYVRIG